MYKFSYKLNQFTFMSVLFNIIYGVESHLKH